MSSEPPRVHSPRTFDLTGKAALVVSPEGALANDTARAFSRAGARVVIARPRSEVAPPSSKEGLDVAEVGKGTVDFDPRSEGVGERLIEWAKRHMGGLDILVYHPDLPVVPARDGPGNRNWEVDVVRPIRGAFQVIEAAARAMIDQGYGGRIILLLPSIPMPSEGPAFARRVGVRSLEGLVEGLAVDLGPFDITVNAVQLGTGVTETEAVSPPTVTPPSLGRIPKGRPGSPTDVASGAVFLASDEADYCTGVVVPIDGGRRLT